MKKILSLLLMAFFAVTLHLSAQNKADDIVGTYKAEKEGSVSKVKVFKHGNGYRAQIFWLQNAKNPDGTVKRDVKNPDPNKRNTPSDQIVLVDNVTFVKDKWTNGKIYDPQSGKVYSVDLYFEKPNVLTVKGKLGPFYKKMYWTKFN
ncbi:MAG: DUF2147 domain-containing protein [Bacteroidaceae bacterium]|nr:DUF2147 domain-containing protein [Bacteroidaceae bacterium]